MPEHTITWTLVTPGLAPSALSGVQLDAQTEPALTAFLRAAGCGAVGVGTAKLRDFGGFDHGLVIRWTGTSALLTPHGGPAARRAICGWLERHGAKPVSCPTPRQLYPEARDALDAAMLWTLSRAASPAAVDAILDHAQRWRRITPREAREWSDDPPASDRPDARDRLINPALVAAVGPSNIGKSTLANVLAGRSVSIVADEPGTTRDYVGVELDLHGLVVRYVDAPGVRASADDTERRALAAALHVARSADLVLNCSDPCARPLDPAEIGLDAARVLPVGLRADLGRAPWTPALGVGVLSGDGIAELTRAIRGRLLPPEALQSQRPWAFWRAAGMTDADAGIATGDLRAAPGGPGRACEQSDGPP